MKLEVREDFKVGLKDEKLNQLKLNTEWIISEVKETETQWEADGKTIAGIVTRNTKTSTVRLYPSGEIIKPEVKVKKKKK